MRHKSTSIPSQPSATKITIPRPSAPLPLRPSGPPPPLNYPPMDRDAAPILGEPPPRPPSRWLRSKSGVAGLLFLTLMFLACVGGAFWTMHRVKPAGVGPDQLGTPRYAWQEREARQLPPTWWPWGWTDEAAHRYQLTAAARAREAEARARGVTAETLEKTGWTPSDEQVRAARPTYLMGTDVLGRDVFVRSLAGGAISLTIGLLAAAIAVTIGTLYGAIAGYVGGRLDAVMMRTVDILYGLPYVLLVVLLAVAADAVMDEYISRAGARASWIHANSDQLAEDALGDAAPRDKIDDWLATTPPVNPPTNPSTSPSTTSPTSPDLRPIILGALQRDWSRLTEESAKERRARQLAVERSRNDRERALAEQIPVREVPSTPPGDAEVDSFLRGIPSVAEALKRAAPLRFHERQVPDSIRVAYNLLALLVAIGGVSWLTMARVIRGQVLSLKSQPFVEAARAVGAPTSRIFLRHLLPNLVGPIVVYAALTVPQAILQESFLSFLGIGVKPPAPSWGNLAADGIAEGINPHRLADSRWWLLVFPCVLLGCTLLALNFLGEGLREAVDPKRTKR